MRSLSPRFAGRLAHIIRCTTVICYFLFALGDEYSSKVLKSLGTRGFDLTSNAETHSFIFASTLY